MDFNLGVELEKLQSDGTIGITNPFDDNKEKETNIEAPILNDGNLKDTKPISIADRVMQEYDIIFYGGQFWYYKDECYRPAEMELRNSLQIRLKDEFTSHKVKEVFYVLESRVHREAIKSDTVAFQRKVDKLRPEHHSCLEQKRRSENDGGFGIKGTARFSA